MSEFLEWLFTDVVIHRNINEWWYVATGIMLGISIALSFKLHFKKFGFLVLISAALMSAVWEIILFSFGFRGYENILAQIIGPIPELIYHSFSETAATFLVGLYGIYALGIIDLEKYKDENYRTNNDKNSEESNI